jgi:hypothetical protein
MDSFNLYKKSQVLSLNLYPHLFVYYALMHRSRFLATGTQIGTSMNGERLCKSMLYSISSSLNLLGLGTVTLKKIPFLLWHLMSPPP